MVEKAAGRAPVHAAPAESPPEAVARLEEPDPRHERIVAELEHRVRNTLAVVRSIIRRTASNSETVEEMASHLQGRIDAFARVQILTGRNAESGIGLDTLIADELLAHATLEGERLSIEGPEILLLPNSAQSLSLAVHELATNAVKFGALGVPDGKVAVRWSIEGEDAGKLRFVWEEHGRDRPLVAVERHGFGFELLLLTLPYDLDAETEVEFLEQGLRFTLVMPLKGAAAGKEDEP